MQLRNLFFDLGVLPSKNFSLPSIGVGNLSMGGTGKSVVVTYLIELFEKSKSVATLSRGYGRNTKGLRIASSIDSAVTLGDEPFQFFLRYPNLQVIVSENRMMGMKAMQKLNPIPEMVVMDDVMQHRWVKPKLMIVTTDYKKPYFNDFILPVGELRELSSGINRADMILVTRTPKDLSISQKESYLKNIKTEVPVFFTGIKYAKGLYQENQIKPKAMLKKGNFILVTGIADASNLVDYLQEKFSVFDHLNFPDHHLFSAADVQMISSRAADKIIITTEKDYGRLSPLLDSDQLYYLKISLDFIFEQDRIDFDKMVFEIA